MSTGTSLVYRNIHIYRLLMNLIYRGKYRERFEKICETIDRLAPRSILELCFCDTYIANHCVNRGIAWRGFDINEGFVRRAIARGHEAVCQDVLQMRAFTRSDLCIISGSLYHFNSSERAELMKKMLASTSRVLISEPVINLSDRKDILGFIARRSANAGKGREDFRYNEQSLRAALDDLGKELNFSYRIIGFIKKDLILLIEKNEAR